MLNKLDDRPVGNRCVFDHDNNTIANDKAQIFTVALLDVVVVQNLYVATDARIFINDNTPHRGVGADSQRNSAAFQSLQTLCRRLVEIRAHEQRVIDYATGFDARANSYDRALNRTFPQN